MRVKQISVFMENRAGRLRDITGTLAKADINIRALSLADTSDFGIFRIIVNKPVKAAQILREAGFIIRKNEVIACVIEDRPGGLHQILSYLGDADISVEYMYGFLERHTDKAVMILRVEDTKKAIDVLQNHNVTLLKGEQIYKM